MPHPQAGKPAPKKILENIPALISAYYSLKPNPNEESQRVAFGTSGHRGSSYKKSFNEDHILAITQAVCEYRKQRGINGPLFIGKDTHALSIPAEITALEVCAANETEVFIAKEGGYTPTPLISFAILEHNDKNSSVSDGIVITPSHNPPSDGGFKYNPPNGGPADTDVTNAIEKRANEILANGLKEVKRVSIEEAKRSGFVKEYDFVTPYVEALRDIVDMDAIKNSSLKIGVDPMGGSGIEVYKKIKEIYGIDLEIVNPYVDFTFSFMTLDHD